MFTTLGVTGLEPVGASDAKNSRLQNPAISSGAESGANQAENAPKAADRLEVIADLLADLPQEQRREVIADLAPADRAAIARLLIGRQGK